MKVALTDLLPSIVIVQGGRIVYERFHPLDGPDTVMDSFSVAKSVTSAAIGLLVGDGLLDHGKGGGHRTQTVS